MGAEAVWLVPAGEGAAETRVRGSRFIALVRPAGDPATADSVVQECSRLRHDASHHCYAWRMRTGESRASDAGEPSGSAGGPILTAIESRGLFDCVVVVTRYFGGTKLGVGGLARAYGHAAVAALDAAPLRQARPGVRLRIRYPYDLTAIVMRLVDSGEASNVEHGYVEGGSSGEVVLSLPAARREEFHAVLGEASAGALEPEVLEEEVLYGPAGPRGLRADRAAAHFDRSEPISRSRSDDSD